MSNQYRKVATLDLKASKRLLAFKSRFAMTDRSRYFIKIQDGCEQFCSYCIIPWTRGKLRSRPMIEVINEVKQAVEAGYREVVLCGIHLGLYGQEALTPSPSPTTALRERGAKKQKNLVELLRKLIKIKNLGRIRLSSIEVTEVGDDLIKLIAANRKICKHLHIPLQSGCDKILKSMNRPYNAKYFKNKVRNIRQSIPDCAITADVIVGFPGETEKDFKETYNFIKEIQFSRLHVFPFSAHEKTPAANMEHKVSGHEIKKRADRLRQLGRKLENEYRKKFIGKEMEVVVESVSKDKIKGKTEYYFDVELKKSRIIAHSERMRVDSNIDLIGKIVKVKTAL